MPIDRSGCPAKRHGDESAYRHQCRCPDAREAHRLSEKRRREGRLVPRTVHPAGFVAQVERTATGARVVLDPDNFARLVEAATR